ncbi:hypothetical protein ACH5RR_022467 [Cinchona calisaya]|uniref:C3H1-type domain-containing protein n=1 Tax=Cinchona calisaya TaxID=153742 RepID=A0ABD2ZBA1_9GENT
MENIYGSAGRSTKPAKFKSLNGNVSPNLNFIGRGGLYQYHHPVPSFDPYASSDSGSNSPNLDSPLIHYLRSSSGSSSGGSGGGGGGGRKLSPLSLTAAIDDFETHSLRLPPVFKTPVKVEEDVLVIDGILVDSSSSKTPKGSGGGKMRSPLSSSDSGMRLPLSLSSSSTSSGGSQNENSFYNYKTEKCRSWEDFNPCRFGSKCQFAHGKEELRPSYFSKNKLEAQLCKSYSSRSCAYGTKCRFVHDQIKAGIPSMGPSPASTVLPTPPIAVTAITPKNKANYDDQNTFTAFSSNYWSPLDDGIGVTLSSASSDETPTKEDVNAHIEAVLYGPSPRKRLPVFTEFCPK